MEPRRDVARLSRSRARAAASARRSSARWWTGSARGGSCCSAGPCSRWGSLGSAYVGALWQMVVLYGVVMTLGAELPRARRVRADPVAPLRAPSRHGDLDRAVGQRLRARGVGAAGSARDLAIGWRTPIWRRPPSWASLVWPLAALFRRAEPPAPAPRRTRRPRAAAPTATPPPPGAADWTLAEAMRDVAFLAAVRGLPVHRARQLLRLAAPARLRGRYRLRQALRRQRARHRRLPRGRPARSSPARCRTTSGARSRRSSPMRFSIVGVICALFITGPEQRWLLWLHACFFGLTWGARGPAITAKTADLFPGPQLGTILGVITIGSGIGVGRRLVGRRMDLRPVRQLPDRLSAVDRRPIWAAASRSGRCAGRRRGEWYKVRRWTSTRSCT